MRRLITPQPGYSLADCDALLNSKQFVTAQCFSIVPTQGAPVRLTDAQEDVSIVGWNDTSRYTYSANQAVITGLKSNCTIGAAVDDQDIEINYSDGSLFQGWKPWPEALLYGRLDGCRITRDIAFAAQWGDPWIGVTRMFSGGDPELDQVGRSSAKLKINSDFSRLAIQMPRDVYSISCRNVFGDARCGVDLNVLAVSGTVGAGATRDMLPWSGASAGFAFGKIHVSNGDSVTRVRTILKADGANLYLRYPLDFDPGSGLAFTAYPGCSRLSTGANGCQTYWSTAWPEHFAGCPFTPVAETAL